MKKPLLTVATARAVLPVVTIVAAVLAGTLLGIEIAILIVAAGALVGVIALVWASVQSLTGESLLTLEEAIGLGAPSAEEEQKRAVLRALKDLEYERGVGKISDEDYAELSERYRAEAKRLMRSLDEHSLPEREKVEKLLAARLHATRTAKNKADPPEPTDAEPSEKSEADSRESDAAPTSEAGEKAADTADATESEAVEKIEESVRPRKAGGEIS